MPPEAAREGVMAKKPVMPARKRTTSARGIKKRIVVTDSRTPIAEEDLIKLVLRALHENGFDWIVAVALNRMRLQNPNWRILRIGGNPPSPAESMKAMSCSAVKALGKEYALLDPRSSPPKAK
jgi:hypothetical protein